MTDFRKVSKFVVAVSRASTPFSSAVRLVFVNERCNNEGGMKEYNALEGKGDKDSGTGYLGMPRRAVPVFHSIKAAPLDQRLRHVLVQIFFLLLPYFSPNFAIYKRSSRHPDFSTLA